MTQQPHKTIGIIGGLGPESTIEYYRLFLAGWSERVPDGSQPSIILNSVDMPKVRGMIAAVALEDLAGYLLHEIEKLARAGADVGLIAANAPHIAFDMVRPRSPIPLISIVEATCDAAKKAGFKKLGLFGAGYTMQGKFYPKVFSRNQIELVVPSPAEQDFIHAIYFGELVSGVVHPETLQKLLAIVERMKREDAIEGLVLGGTELSLIFREPTAQGLPVLDTTRIHVQRVLDEVLA